MYIKTANGWKIINGPMAEMPKLEPWWRSVLTALRLKHDDKAWREWDSLCDKTCKE